MEEAIGILVVIGLIGALVYAILVLYWQYVLLAACVGGTIWVVVVQIKKDKVAAREAEAERQRLRNEEEVRVRRQHSLRTQLVETNDHALRSYDKLPEHLLQAEALLDDADRLFRDRAFEPFWSVIEEATMCLGRFNAGVSSITKDLELYHSLSNEYESKSPQFPIGIDAVSGLAAGSTTADRMKAIVQPAHRDYQFAMILQHRRTNQILVAGFTNLAQSIAGMGQMISESVDKLSTQVSDMSESLNGAMASIEQQVARVGQTAAESAQEFNSNFQKEAKEQAERHDRALKMLDNIQRGRQPTGFYLDLETKPAPCAPK